jgi:hypothetical protein
MTGTREVHGNRKVLMRATASWWAGLSVMAGLLVGGATLFPPAQSGSGEAQGGGRPECPHDWDAKSGQFEEVGPIRDIPEFHDCQRFIVYQNGGPQHDSLYAIFAVADLAGIEERLASTVSCAECFVRLGGRERIPPAEGFQPLRERATTLGVVAARVYAEGNYPPLGIQRMHDCLYLFRADTLWGALMMPVKDANSDCRKPIDPAIPWGTELEVRRVVTSGMGADDYPAVARWDWDSAGREQYMGVKCGAAWCEIGKPGFVSSPLPRVDPNVAGLLGRTARVKGWYDEQYLAVVDDEGNTTPSLIRGRIFPALELDRVRQTDALLAKWTVVAWIMVDTLPMAGSSSPGLSPGGISTLQGHVGQYNARLNFESRVEARATVVRRELNQLEMCHGTFDQCEIPRSDRTQLENCDTDGQWWARVMAPSGRMKYLCVTRRGHENLRDTFPVPGTARWRWMASDEGVWNACGQGCCETLGPGG